MIAPPLRFAPAQRRTLVLPVLGMVLLSVCALIAVGLASTEIGAAGVVVGVTVALLPVVPVVATFLWMDRFEPEPPRLLLMAFLWGAGLAALVSIVINTSAVIAAELLIGQGQGDIVGAVISAPLVEEFAKGAFVVGLLIVRRREFDGVVDGVVYAGITAAGFAFTENIIYFGRAFADAGETSPATAVLVTFILRGLISPFAHPLFTAMIGIAAGIAAGMRSRLLGGVVVLAGYVAAVVLHALWNATGTTGTFFGVYVLVMVPLFVAVIGLVMWQRRREKRILAEQMPGFAAAGWIAASEVPLLSSMAGRRRWRAAVRSRSGPEAARAVEDYQHAVTSLAFLRARAARGAIEPRPEWHAERLDEVYRTRMVAVGAPHM